jgi:hypothetical protein
MGGDQFETYARGSQQITDGLLVGSTQKTAAFAPDQRGAQEHEAKEHDLPLVRQKRA